jgi:hypothetical protein
MEAPLAQAGNKINCLKCGQRLQIPSAEHANTILASGMGVHDDVEQRPLPQSQPTIPTAVFASALPLRVPTATSSTIPESQPHPEAEEKSDDPAAIMGRMLSYVNWEWRRLPTSFPHWPVILLCFFPWINVSCNGQRLASQSGVQACYGGTTLAPNMQALADRAKAQGGAGANNTNPPEPAFFIWVFAILAVVGAVTGVLCIPCVFLPITKPAGAILQIGSLGCGVLCFFCLGLQCAFGFPLENRVARANNEARNPPPILVNNPFQPGMQIQQPNPFAQAANAMVNIEAEYTPWLWLEFLFTFICIPFFALELGLGNYQLIRFGMHRFADSS